MTIQDIIELITRRKNACELALHDLYNLYALDGDESINIDIIRIEEEIETYKSLLQDIPKL